MRDAAREAIGFVTGRTSDQFAADRMLALAVLKEIEIMGEAASKVSAETRARLPRIPWPDACIVGSPAVRGGLPPSLSGRSTAAVGSTTGSRRLAPALEHPPTSA